MAEQPSISAILAQLAARSTQTPPQNPPPQPPYQQPPQQQNQYPQAPPGGYPLPQPTSSGSVHVGAPKPISSGSVNIGGTGLADAIAKAKAIAAERGIQYAGPPQQTQQQSYRPQENRASGGRPYQQRERSRSPQPARRDAFRDNFNPYRDERRGDNRAPPGRDYRDRSFSPGLRGRGPVNTFSPARGNNGAGGYSPRDQDGEDSFEHINIESNLVGLIIGRSGENLRRIEAETGCRVQFITGPDDSGPYRQCKITGNKARRAATKAELNRIIDESGMSASARQGGGSNDRRPPIREVQPPPSRGAPPASAHQPALRDGEDSMQIMVPDRTVGLIIGRGGETIRDLQERSGCHVNIVGEQKSVNGLRPVNLIGTREAAARAKDMIMEIVESDSKAKVPEPRGPPQREPAGRDSYGAGAYGGGGGGAGGDKSSDSIFVPSDAVGMIIGKGGETIKDMQSTTSCKINVSPSSGPHETEREIGLVGSRDAINAAKRAIEDKVEAVQNKDRMGGRDGGGRDGGGRRPQNDYGDRNYSQQQSSYSQPQSQAAAPSATATADAADPYAQYGGYQAYVALWYQAMAAQQAAGGGQASGDSTQPPPGTS